MFDLPINCKVNKFIPKNTFYDKVTINSATKKDFINKIEKITWLYKLSDDTIGINKTDEVEEIQIFEVILKEKEVSKNVLKTIAKSIQYPILFILKYNNNFCYAILVEDLYITDLNKEIEFKFNAINLKVLYENIVKQIINEEDNNNKFTDIIEQKNEQERIEKEIQKLKNAIKREKQFNRKVELNRKLNELKKESYKNG